MGGEDQHCIGYVYMPTDSVTVCSLNTEGFRFFEPTMKAGFKFRKLHASLRT